MSGVIYGIGDDEIAYPVPVESDGKPRVVVKELELGGVDLEAEATGELKTTNYGISLGGVALEAEATGELKTTNSGISLGGVALEAQSTGELKTAQYGLFGGGMQRSPLPFGPSGGVYISVINLTLAAGSNDLDSSAVPAGEIWVITNTAILYVGTAPTSMAVYIVNGGTEYLLWRQNAPVSGTLYDRQGYWYLGAGDVLRAKILGATLNDDGHLRGTGFRMDTDQ